jgi:hypothetical protein
MANTDLVKRMQAAGRRSAGHVCIEDESRWHRAQLAQDVGFDPHAARPEWRDPEDSVVPTVRRLAYLTLLIALLALGGAGWYVWRDGTLADWLGKSSSSFKIPKQAWSFPKEAAAAIDQEINAPAPPPQWDDPYEAPKPAPPAEAETAASSEDGASD